ncbi:MAG: BON domain-containing protein [Caulobacter sp.]|nr:BON domain-containing protein [Caulobacter sp.]
MANPFIGTPTRDWREERGWSERSSANGAFGEARYTENPGRRAGYNPAGPAQGYVSGGYNEPRSWSDVEQDRHRNLRTSRYGDPAYRDPAYGDGGAYYGRDGRYEPYDDDYGRQDRYQPGRGYAGGDRVGFGDPNPYVQSATDGDSKGPHHGRGPRDYRRSDDRIREDVNDHLTDHHHLDASNIQVEVKDGEVTLNGRVDRRGDKRRAEDCAERVRGVRHVQNNLRVDEVDGSGRFAPAATSTDKATASRGGAN